MTVSVRCDVPFSGCMNGTDPCTTQTVPNPPEATPVTTTDDRVRSNAITAAPALLTLIPGVVYGPEYHPYTLSPWILHPCVIALPVAYGGLFLWLFHRG